ncbi:hypothetical protein BC833DRAFT_237070 [Globomyces pollinis-pini]|nr:hypothetical protein BC833DRAFT_237070 [Globomyces pollinis-pini]
MDMKGWKDGELLVAIQLSIYHETFKFTKSIGLNHPQANTIYGIIQNTIESIANSVKDTSTYLEEFKKLLLKVLRSPMHQETMDSYNETIPLEKFPAIVNFAMKTVFQHIQLYRFVFTQEQSISLIPITKQFETIPIYEPLKEAVIPKIDIEREVEELIQQDWLDPFAADLDIFDSLSPAEIKTVVYDTIVSMIKNLQSDCDRMVMDHQLKISNHLITFFL